MLQFIEFDSSDKEHLNYVLYHQSILYIDLEDGSVKSSFLNSQYIGDGKTKYFIGTEYEFSVDLVLNKIHFIPYTVE